MGMEGLRTSNIQEGATELARRATGMGQAISDYVLAPGHAGVFVVATHDESEWRALNYLKLADESILA
jgi:hypothetical protein